MLTVLFEAPQPDRKRTWQWVWPLLVVGFSLRLLVAAYYPLMAHPDEVFQYTEQAHRLVYGYGVIPWEYVYGIRSWIIPLGLAGLLEVGRLVGLDEPWEYIPLVNMTLCALSLTLPLGIYRLSQHLMDERGAIYAFLFGVFWWHFIYFAHKPMPGILATYALVWLCVLLYRRPTRINLLVLGLLAGAVLVLRYQLLPVVGLLGLLAMVRLRSQVWPAIASLGGVVLIAGMVDLWSWGGFLFSFFENFRLNLVHDISSIFGVSGLSYYASEIGRESAGLILLAIPGTICIWRTSWPVVVAVVAGVAALHIPGHKEFRFVLWSFPFMFIGLAAGLSFVVRKLKQTSIPITLPFAITILWGSAVSASWVYADNSRVRPEIDLRSTFLEIARDPDVTGIELLRPQIHWSRTYGYYSLGHRVPVYSWTWKNNADDHRIHVSHVVTKQDTVPPPGYDLAFEIGSFRTWTANRPRTAVNFRDIDFRAPQSGEQFENVVPRARSFGLETTD